MGGKITLWEMFFMIVAVIPVSKMLSQIFMSLIARIGTVDEEKWAAIGMGALGTLGGLLLMGKTATGALRGIGKSSFPGGVGPGSAGPQGGVSVAGPGSLGPQGGAGVGLPGASLPGGLLGGGASSPSPGLVGGGGGASGAAQPGGNACYSFAAGPGAPPGYASTPGGLLVPGGAGGSGSGPVSAQPQEPMSLQEAVGRGGAAADEAGKLGFMFGAASGMGAPAVAPAIGSVLGSVSKMATGALATTYQIGRGLAQNMLRYGAKEGIKRFAGAQGGFEALGKVAGSLALSAFGSRAAQYGSRVVGGLGNRMDAGRRGYHSTGPMNFIWSDWRRNP